MEPRSLQYVAAAAGGELLHGSPGTIVSRLCTDSRQAAVGDLFFAITGERFDAHAFLPEVALRGVAAVVADRKKLPVGFRDCPVIVVDSTRPALGRLASYYRNDFQLPIIAVGGSNGKTTTKELIGSVVRQKKSALSSEASFNNDIGVPLTLLQLDGVHQVAVLEVGTNHPGELAPLLAMIKPRFGVITNIGREHLEFFGDLAGVAREEGAMAEALPADGVLFLNGDNEWSEKISQRTQARIVKVGLGPKNDCIAENVRFEQDGVAFFIRSSYPNLNGEYRIKLLGRHQVANALFAFAVGAELGLDKSQIERGLAEAAPAKMRMQLWQVRGLRIIDDSYNANADSMLAALQTLSEMPCAGRKLAVLGDMAELGETSDAAHREVGSYVAKAKVDQLFTLGESAKKIAQAARANGLPNVTELADVETAANAVRDFARSGDLILVKASRAMKMERITESLRKE